MPEADRIVELLVDSRSASQRLDVYLAESLPELSRSRIRKLIDSGMVSLAGAAARPGMKLKGGERITLHIPEDEPLDVKAEDIPLDIVFEDPYLLVVNKPAGMVVHPAAGVSRGTLVNALLHHCSDLSGISGVLRPGIVHRLDKDTSGLLVVAKGDVAHQRLADQIRHKTARREYLAILEGVVGCPSGTVREPIGRHRTDRKRMAVVEGGRDAVTHYHVIKRSHRFTLIRAVLETGRTHQIRVHMASLGYPVVGDIAYNRKRTGTVEQRRKLGISGHALHAFRLSFTHPVSGRLLEFEAPLPPDLKQLADSL